MGFDDVTMCDCGCVYQRAMEWYTSQGCTTDKLAIGLLSGETSSESETATMFDLIATYDVDELDVWVNLWTDADAVAMWEPYLRSFVAGERAR